MSEPSYTLEFVDKPGYLVARVTGPADSVDIKLAYLAEAAATCRARGKHRLLIIEELAGVLPAAEVQKLGPRIPPIVKGLIVAFIDLRPEHHEINRLGEAIAVDHGAVGRVFRTLDEAEKWISAVP